MSSEAFWNTVLFVDDSRTAGPGLTVVAVLIVAGWVLRQLLTGGRR